MGAGVVATRRDGERRAPEHLQFRRDAKRVRRMCRRFAGTLSRARLRLPKRFPRLALAQLVVVALPEEYFFRGYVQTRL